MISSSGVPPFFFNQGVWRFLSFPDAACEGYFIKKWPERLPAEQQRDLVEGNEGKSHTVYILRKIKR